MMNKELEALENILKGYAQSKDTHGLSKDLHTVKKALERLEAIESVDGGEVLKALQSLTKKGVENSKKGYLDIDNEWNTINNFIKKSQQQEKELEELKREVLEVTIDYRTNKRLRHKYYNDIVELENLCKGSEE